MKLLRLPYPHGLSLDSPMAALVKRELRMTLRDGRNFFWVALVLGVMTLAGAAFSQFIAGTSMSDPNFGLRIGEAAFQAYTQLLFLSAMLLIPAVAATAVCLDRQKGELDALLLTHITPEKYLIAKALRILSLFGILTVATLPFSALMFFYSGLETVRFLSLLYVLVLSAISSAMAGLLCSSAFRSQVHALLATVALVLMIQYGIGLCFFHTFQSIFGNPADFWGLDFCNATALPLLMSVDGDYIFTPFVYTIATTYHVLAVALFFALARRFVVRPVTPTPRHDAHPIDNTDLLNARRRKFPYYLLDPRRRRPLIGDRQNPIFVREAQAGFAGSAPWRIRTTIAFGIGAVLMSTLYVLYGDDGPRTTSPRYTPTMLQGLLLLSLMPIFVAPAMAKEFESKNISALRTTLLKPREIALGKLHAAVTAMAPLGGGLLLGTLPLLVMDYPPLLKDLGTLSATFPYILSVVVLAAWGSRKTSTSLVLGYSAGLMALVGLPYLSTFVIEFLVPQYLNLPIDDVGASSFLSPVLARIHVHDTERVGLEVSGAREYLMWNQIIFASLTFPLLLIAYGRFRWQFCRS